MLSWLLLSTAIIGLTVSACKRRIEPDEAALRSEEGADTKRLTFEVVAQNIKIGAGWNNVQNAATSTMCVDGDPDRPASPAVAALWPLGGMKIQAARDFPVPRPDVAASARTRPVSSLRLEEAPMPRPASLEPQAILERFPKHLPWDAGAFPNNYTTFVASLGRAVTPSFLRLLDGAAPGAPPGATNPQVIKDLAEKSKCSEPSMVTWLTALDADKTNTAGVAVEMRTFVLSSIEAAAEALHLKGELNVNIINGIGAKLAGSADSVMSLNSDNSTLFLDVTVASQLESFRDKAPIGFNSDGYRLSDVGKKLKDARPFDKNELLRQCGDQWVFALARGARYVTQYQSNRFSQEKTIKFHAEGKLAGLKLGPASIDVSGTVDYESYALDTNISESVQLFDQFNGSRPEFMPESAACRVAYAAALPRATKAGGPIVAFATVDLPESNGATGNLTGSKEATAKEYVKLLQRIGKLAHLLYQFRNLPYAYNLIKESEFDAAQERAATAYKVLTGEKLDAANDPSEKWKNDPKSMGGLLGDALENAQTSLVLIKRADPAGRQAALDKFADLYKADLLLLAEQEAKLDPLPTQNGESYFTQFAPEVAGKTRAAKQTPEQAAVACGKMNQDEPFLTMTTSLQKRHPTWGWRLPSEVEVRRIRWGANGLLNNDPMPVAGDGDAPPHQPPVYINAVRPEAPLSAAQYIQVDVNDYADEPQGASVRVGSTEPEFTICVFGPS